MWRTTCPDGANADARAAGPAEADVLADVGVDTSADVVAEVSASFVSISAGTGMVGQADMVRDLWPV